MVGRYHHRRSDSYTAARELIHIADMGARSIEREEQPGFCRAGIVCATVEASLNPIRPNEERQVRAVQEGEAEGKPEDVDDKLICGGCKTHDEDDDVRRPKPASRPYTPTREEVYEHEVTHLPFRTWCKHCVFGKGVSSPHVKPDNKEKIGITISFDYCFMVDEEKSEDTPAVLVMWDDNHECLWALPVESKGPIEYVVKWVNDKLDAIGYRGTPLTLKSDQEPAIKALKAAVAARRVAPTTPVESPVRESQSNGAVERAIRSWQGQLRTLKSQFEENTGKKLSVNHPLMGWLVCGVVKFL